MGNDLQTVLLLYSAISCIFRFFGLSSSDTVTTLVQSHLASFLQFPEVIPAFFRKFALYIAIGFPMKKIFLCVVLYALCGMGCAPYVPKDADYREQLVALSQWNTDNDFSRYNTYLISDSLCVLSAKGQLYMEKTRLSQLVHDRVDFQLKRMGYQPASTENKPDIVINLSLLKTTNVEMSVNYWGFYIPQYWDSWGEWTNLYGDYVYYYPIIYFPMLSASYVVNSLLFEMVDMNKESEGEGSLSRQLEVVWMGIVRGIADFTYTDEVMEKAIDRCFEQTNFKGVDYGRE